MKQRSYKVPSPHVLLLAFALACILAQGVAPPAFATCRANLQGSHTAQAYADSYNTLMQEYRAKMVALTSRPLPPKTLPKKEWRAKMAGQLDDLATATASFAHRMDALKPPPSLRPVHAATRAFFQVSAQANRRVAAAIRTGVKDAVDKAFAETERAESKAVARIGDACTTAGGDADAISQTVQTMTTGAAP